MADYDRDVVVNRTSAVGWVALVVSIIALILAWVAYNRAGEDLENQVGQGIEQTIENADDAADEAGEAAQEASDATEEAIDEGPDWVDDGTQ